MRTVLPEEMIRCKVGCCEVPRALVKTGALCNGCRGAGYLCFDYDANAYQYCGACHGYGVHLSPPRWMIATASAAKLSA